MIKVDKSYTIKFAYGGVPQYHIARESQGKLINTRFFVSYMKPEHQSIVEEINKSTDVNEVLELIKSLAYSNRAEITLINNAPIPYATDDKAKSYVKNFGDKFDAFIKNEAIEYFNEILLPILITNKWFVSSSHVGYPIIIYKNENDEWDNIPKDENSLYFEYLCYQFLKNFKEIEVDLKPQYSSPRIDCFYMLNNILGEDFFKEKNLLIEF